MTLDNAIYLTLNAHEWYWDLVWQECKTEYVYRRRELPKVYLLHHFYRQHQTKLQVFDGYANWEAVFRLLGCPVTYFGTPGSYLPVATRYRIVRDCFTGTRKKIRRRRRWWERGVGGKWQRKWEPTPEAAEQKKKAREHKQQWREMSGKNRDRRRSKLRRGPGGFYKRVRSQSHRAWSKHHLRTGNWDALHSRDRDQFFDWYTWV